MTVCRISSAMLSGLDVQPIGVEVDVRRGMPNFTVVGMAQEALRECRDRVVAAIKNAGFEMPTMKVTVNLTPVSLKKTSPLLDLPIAVGVLAASKQIPPPEDTVFLGELSLDGTVRTVPGALAILDGLNGGESVVLPESNLPDASLLATSRKSGRRSVRGLGHLSGLALPIRDLPSPRRRARPAGRRPRVQSDLDFSEIRGQHLARRAAEISAAGGHHLILIGPPGTGKSMLAHRLPTILPPLDPRESLDVTKIHSVAGLLAEPSLLEVRPFRSPHHTLSDVALIGGGPQGTPGEISLAHCGVLFLDEFPEFPRSCLEALRQPLEERRVTISRAAVKVSYPSNFLLLAAMNPCPCGYFNHPVRPCRCSATDVRRYLNKLSGPILNRIDLQVELSPESTDLILEGPPGEGSDAIRARVAAARSLQECRQGAGRPNAHLTPSEVRRHCALSGESTRILRSALDRMSVSPRTVEKILKVARTIADLSVAETGAPAAGPIAPDHFLEAIRFRALDVLTIETR